MGGHTGKLTSPSTFGNENASSSSVCISGQLDGVLTHTLSDILTVLAYLRGLVEEGNLTYHNFC